MTTPDYRVRLFLSVDLTGSTAFKENKSENNGAWLKIFRTFYGKFPKQFADEYLKACNDIPSIQNQEKDANPKVWKTIGDEIIFVNRVLSITHLGACITAFSKVLKSFGQEISSNGLNTKGNAWIAAFPHPNHSIALSLDGSEDPMSGNEDFVSEDFELKVDEIPSKFDFLGKGIDGGFRISKNSTIDSFTISPALALLLCKARKNEDETKFECEFEFHEPQIFKGVVRGESYPVISIQTNRNDKAREIRNLQAALLQQPTCVDFAALREYLEKYFDHHQIEYPALKLSYNGAHVNPPQHYSDYIKRINDTKEVLDAADANVGESDHDETTDDTNFEKFHEDALERLRQIYEIVEKKDKDDNGPD